MNATNDVDYPIFAVVGRVNKGKSSVIASLIESDAIKISPRPGTTTECVRYEVEQDGRVLFSVVDTPGFEDAPAHFIGFNDARPAPPLGSTRLKPSSTSSPVPTTSSKSASFSNLSSTEPRSCMWSMARSRTEKTTKPRWRSFDSRDSLRWR